MREWEYEATTFDEGDKFFWSEGNFGCDCNRGLMFEWAVHGDGNEVADYPCGDRFRIQLQLDGVIVLDEIGHRKPVKAPTSAYPRSA